MQAAADLNQFANYSEGQEEGFRVELLSPLTFEPFGSYITIAGPGSRRAMKAFRKVTRLFAEGKIRDVEEVQTHLVALSIISWENILKDGQPLLFSYETAVEVLTEFPWIEWQLERKSAVKENFIKS